MKSSGVMPVKRAFRFVDCTVRCPVDELDESTSHYHYHTVLYLNSSSGPLEGTELGFTASPWAPLGRWQLQTYQDVFCQRAWVKFVKFRYCTPL
jgi:hypothetical protein